MSITFRGPLEQRMDILFIIRTFKPNLDNLGGVTSQHYAHDLMFILRVFIGNIVHHNTIPYRNLLLIFLLFIICPEICFFP